MTRFFSKPRQRVALAAPVWTTTFFDDFLGSSLDTTKWFPGAAYDGTSPNTRGFTAGPGGPGGPSGEFQLYKPGNVTVANSICTLTAKAESISGDPNNGGLTPYNYTGGCIQTQPGIPDSNTRGFLFNLAQRTRLSALVMFHLASGTSMTGMFPAFWASSASPNFFSNPYVLEVDCMEIGISGNVDISQPSANIHYCSSAAHSSCDQQGGPGQAGPSFSAPIPTIALDRYHVVMCDMNYDGHGSFAFFVDGIRTKVYRQIPGYAFRQDTGDPVEMAIIANFAINAATPTAAALPATVNYDWIKAETTPTFANGS